MYANESIREKIAMTDDLVAEARAWRSQQIVAAAHRLKTGATQDGYVGDPGVAKEECYSDVIEVKLTEEEKTFRDELVASYTFDELYKKYKKLKGDVSVHEATSKDVGACADAQPPRQRLISSALQPFLPREKLIHNVEAIIAVSSDISGRPVIAAGYVAARRLVNHALQQELKRMHSADNPPEDFVDRAILKAALALDAVYRPLIARLRETDPLRDAHAIVKKAVLASSRANDERLFSQVLGILSEGVDLKGAAEYDHLAEETMARFKDRTAFVLAEVNQAFGELFAECAIREKNRRAAYVKDTNQRLKMIGAYLGMLLVEAEHGAVVSMRHTMLTFCDHRFDMARPALGRIASLELTSRIKEGMTAYVNIDALMHLLARHSMATCPDASRMREEFWLKVVQDRAWPVGATAAGMIIAAVDPMQGSLFPGRWRQNAFHGIVGKDKHGHTVTKFVERFSCLAEACMPSE